MAWHLPLNPIDRVNQPPLYFLQIQDALILLTSMFWTVAYVLYVRQAFRDKSYGMPIVCLYANVAWELLFGVIAPTSVAQTVGFVPWLIIDIGIVYTTWKFGPAQWKSAPMVSNNMGWILTIGMVATTAMFWAFIKTVGLDAASFYIGYGDQLLISTTSVTHLLARNNTSGHSWGIWFWRSTGTFLSIVLFAWRYAHYPSSYPRIEEPLTVFFFVAAEVMDLIYPFVYSRIESMERSKSK